MGLGVVIFTVRVEVEQDLFLDYHFLMAAESASIAFRFPVSGEGHQATAPAAKPRAPRRGLDAHMDEPRAGLPRCPLR